MFFVCRHAKLFTLRLSSQNWSLSMLLGYVSRQKPRTRRRQLLLLFPLLGLKHLILPLKAEKAPERKMIRKLSTLRLRQMPTLGNQLSNRARRPMSPVWVLLWLSKKMTTVKSQQLLHPQNRRRNRKMKRRISWASLTTWSVYFFDLYVHWLTYWRVGHYRYAKHHRWERDNASNCSDTSPYGSLYLLPIQCFRLEVWSLPSFLDYALNSCSRLARCSAWSWSSCYYPSLGWSQSLCRRTRRSRWRRLMLVFKWWQKVCQ